jgi:hypothetical protein
MTKNSGCCAWRVLYSELINTEIIMSYRPVGKRWLCKQRPLLGNARNIHARNNRRTLFVVVRAATVSGQRLDKHVPATKDTNATIEERCSLSGPNRDVISKGQSSLIVQFCMGGCEQKYSGKSATMKRRVYMWYLECVIQWYCYSSCVKVLCQETASEDYNRLRTLVRVSQ